MSKTTLLKDEYDLSEISNEKMVATALSSLNKLLVEKGLLTAEEIQNAFLKELEGQGITLKKRE